MAIFGAEAFVSGVPTLYESRPLNLVYSVRIINPKSTNGQLINIPISALGVGELVMVIGDLGWYDKTINQSGTRLCSARRLTFTTTNLSLEIEDRLNMNGGAMPSKNIVINFFRKR